MNKHLIKRLIEEETKLSLLERRRTNPVVMYHGTTSEFLPGILSNGLTPDPKKKTWEDDPDVSSVQSSRVSLPGTYLTSNFLTAYSSAGNAKRKFGGNRVFVIAQVVPQSAYADEDDLKGPVERAFINTVTDSGFIGHDKDLLWLLKGAIDSKKFNKQALLNQFSKELHERFRASEKHPVDLSLMENVFDSYLDRILSHTNDPANVWKYREGLIQFGADEKAEEVAETKELPRKSISVAEKDFLRSLEPLSKRYKELAKDTESLVHSLRMPTTVGFRGRNKILSIVLIHDENERPMPMSIVYGSVTSKFIEDFKKNIGSNFILKKKDQTIYEPPKKESINRLKSEHCGCPEKEKETEQYITEKLALSSYKDFCNLVADAYDDLPNYDKEAVASYQAFISHIEKMYKRIQSKVDVKFVEGQPYSSQKEMAEDVKETGVLKISTDFNEHEVFTPEQNLKLRAVHDYIVHILANVDFSDKGEVAAFNAHAKMLPPKAIPAAFTEIVGQACYANARGHFPKQKVAIMQGFDFKDVGQVKGYDVRNKKLVKDDELEGENVNNIA